MNIHQICMRCMTGKLDERGVCTNCGTDNSTIRNGNLHLPVRTILKGKYLVGSVIGEGGFGITYIGFDLALESRVAIKEFCPREYVSREASDGMTLYPYNADEADFFETEKEKFINEARRLAKFRNEDGVVSVLDYFKENGTAYIVMDYIDGFTLKSYVKNLQNQGRNMGVEAVLRLLRPVMETLAKIHKENIIHRDISLENIMVSNDFQKVYLIDFGTARDIQDGHTLSGYSKSFYTPIEQRSTTMQQGPWTDIYALCATIYVCITGKKLPDSVARIGEDDLLPPSRYGVRIAPSIEEALLKGLAVKPKERVQSMEELMQAFGLRNDDAIQDNYAQNDNAQNSHGQSSYAQNSYGEQKNVVVKQPSEESFSNKTADRIKDRNFELARKDLENRIKSIRKPCNIFLCITTPVAVFYLFFISHNIAMYGPKALITILMFLIFFILYFGVIHIYEKKEQSKQTKAFLSVVPSEEKLQLQIEWMESAATIMRKKSREKYLEKYSRYFDKRTHSIHMISGKIGSTRFVCNRFDLIGYFNNVILPDPKISNSMKEQWRRTAAESWIIIE